MLNKAIIVGRLTKDPQLRYTQSNIAYARFTVATNRPFKEDGEHKADFISCVAWRNQAENLAKYVSKGGLVGIEGRIQTGSFEDNDGKRIYTTDIVCDNIQFLEPKQYNSEEAKQVQRDIRPESNVTIDVSEDMLPF